MHFNQNIQIAGFCTFWKYQMIYRISIFLYRYKYRSENSDRYAALMTRHHAEPNRRYLGQRSRSLQKLLSFFMCGSKLYISTSMRQFWCNLAQMIILTTQYTKSNIWVIRSKGKLTVSVSGCFLLQALTFYINKGIWVWLSKKWSHWLSNVHNPAPWCLGQR